MNILRIAFIGFFLGTVGTFVLGAIEWPLPPTALSTTFGQEREGEFFLGVEIESSSPAQPVAPIDEGEIIFRQFSKEDSAGRSDLVTFIALAHKNEFRSVYGPLREVAEQKTQEKVSTKERVGLSKGGNLFLMIFDQRAKRVINPLLVLPRRPRKNREHSVTPQWLIDAKGQALPLKDGMLLQAGRYQLRGKLQENRKADGSFASFKIPRMISITHLGNELWRTRWDFIEEQRGNLVLGSGDQAEQLYRKPHYYEMGPFHLDPGKGTLEVEEIEISGDKRVRTFQLEVSAS